MAKLQTGYGQAFDAEYERLPESIKAIYSPKDYAWIPPERRANLIDEECMPEVAED